VSIPVWRTPVALVDRAVESCLANSSVQTVVVTGDGAPVDYWHADRRVLVWHTPVQRGRYFVDDVVSRACRTPYFTVHDADDYSDAGRLDRLLLEEADVAYTDRETTHLDGRKQMRYAKTVPPYPVDIIWGVMALYRTEFVRGLFHPGFRVSWDALLDNIGFQFAARRRHVRGPLYRIVKRPGSLTTDNATRLRSEYRKAVTVVQRPMWDYIATLASVGEVRNYIASTVTPRLAAERDAQVARLKERL